MVVSLSLRTLLRKGMRRSWVQSIRGPPMDMRVDMSVFLILYCSM